MKKQTIIVLANAGIAAMTNHSLDTAQAYKVVKFRKALNAALEAIGKDEETIRKDAGIDDPQAFDKELMELRESKSDPKRLEEMEGQLKRFNELRMEMLKEEVELDCKTLPYAEWHKLQCENKEVGDKKIDLLSGWVEDVLEGVLWVAPEDKD